MKNNNHKDNDIDDVVSYMQRSQHAQRKSAPSRQASSDHHKCVAGSACERQTVTFFLEVSAYHDSSGLLPVHTAAFWAICWPASGR